MFVDEPVYFENQLAPLFIDVAVAEKGQLRESGAFGLEPTVLNDARD
jgi:hypothetical protein